MTVYGGIFYFLAALILISTGFAIATRNLLHSIIYLVVSFLWTALLFYLLGAPFLAAMEVIIYAGAIMVLFLVVVMTLHSPAKEKSRGAYLRQWVPALLLAAVSLGVSAAAFFIEPGVGVSLGAAMFSPLAFGRFLFEEYWLAVEIVSFLLFVALVGGLYLGRDR